MPAQTHLHIAYYIIFFDVVQMKFSVRGTHSRPLSNPEVGDFFFYFVDQEKMSECGFICQCKTVSASYMQCCNKAVLKSVECTLRTYASGENMTSKSEQILWSFLVKLRISP